MPEVVDASALELLTVPEVAVLLRVSNATVWRRVYTGEIESVTVGRLRRIPPSAVSDYIAGRQTASRAAS